MRPRWVTQYYQIMINLNLVWVNMLKTTFFWSLNSEILRLFFEDIFWGTLDTNAKNEPALGSSGGREAR